ncbi:hypothetical protein AX16_006648 [Volvariella volvacea WC 439]|nr:hypothetical protein AX16_006648 [Volvariella volvacea WC 439]
MSLHSTPYSSAIMGPYHIYQHLLRNSCAGLQLLLSTITGIVHFIEVENTYKGYQIPVGLMVATNAWVILQDEMIYTDLSAFNLDCFLKDGRLNTDMQDPEKIAFGSGRRKRFRFTNGLDDNGLS